VSSEYGLVLAAGTPDEEGIGKEVADLIAELQKTRGNIWWIKNMLPHNELTAMLTGADLFVCPSVYEPLGIVNLEAMGCETAVLGSRVGGIPEVVAEKETGELVDYTGDAAHFENALTESITRLMSQPELLKKYGTAGRVRVMKEFGWDTVAAATIALYKRMMA
jgi:starch synthase